MSPKFASRAFLHKVRAAIEADRPVEALRWIAESYMVALERGKPDPDLLERCRALRQHAESLLESHRRRANIVVVIDVAGWKHVSVWSADAVQPMLLCDREGRKLGRSLRDCLPTKTAEEMEAGILEAIERERCRRPVWFPWGYRSILFERVAPRLVRCSGYHSPVSLKTLETSLHPVEQLA